MTLRTVRQWPRTPIAVGVILVVCLDGIPGLDLERLNQTGSFRYTDLCFVALIAIGGWRLLLGQSERPTGLTGRAYAWWAVLFTAVWLLAVFQGAWYGAGIASAALFERQYLYLAILGPLAPYLVRSPRELKALLVTLGTLVAIFCVVLIGGAVGVLPASLANPDHTLAQSGLTRIYTYMGDNNLIDLTFCVSLAMWVLDRHRFRLAGPLALLSLLALLVLLTRALYLGSLVGIGVSALVAGVGGDASRPVRRALIAFGTALTILVLCLVVFVPGALTAGPVKSVAARGVSGITAVGARSGTVGVRLDDTQVMLSTLGSKWLFGIGFRPPSTFYVPSLPEGNIEDIDVAGLDSVVAMGAIGTLLLIAPMVVACGIALVRSRRASPFQFLYLGMALWLVSAIAGLPSLGAADQTAGVVTLAVGVGILLRVYTWETVVSPAVALTGSRAATRSDLRGRVAV